MTHEHEPTDQVILGTGEFGKLRGRDTLSGLLLDQERKDFQVHDRAKRSILRRLCMVRSPAQQKSRVK